MNESINSEKISNSNKASSVKPNQDFYEFKYIVQAEQFIKTENEKRVSFKEKLVLFAEDAFNEEKQKSTKKWIVATVDSLREYAMNIPPNIRCLHGGYSEHEPVFGFFDLEFELKWNPTGQMDQLVDYILDASVFQDTLIQVFGHCPGVTDRITRQQFLVLTASNDEKESIHVHGPFNLAFKTLYDLKLFASKLIERLKSDPIAQKLGFVYQKHDNQIRGLNETYVIDMAVYRHNGCFRLYNCAKAWTDQFRPLIEHRSLSQYRCSGEEDREDELFGRSIVGAVDTCSVPLLSAIDQKQLKQLIPRSARERNHDRTQTSLPKHAFFMRHYPSADSSTATHFEWTPPKRPKDTGKRFYRKITEEVQRNTLFEQMLKASLKNRYYCTYEMVSIREKIRLSVEAKLNASDSIPSVLSRIMPDIQRSIIGRKSDCWVISLNPNQREVRFIWSDLYLYLDTDEQNTFMNNLTHSFEASSLSLVNIYERGYASMLGSSIIADSERPQELFCSKLIAKYDRDGNEVNFSGISLDVLLKICCLT